MRLALVGVLLLGGCTPAPKWYEAQQSPAPRLLDWHGDVWLLDPLTTDSSTVDDLHRAHKHAVCHLGPIRPTDPDARRPSADALRDRLKLCRDKGFDAVTFDSPTPDLQREAAHLNLPVLAGPPGARSAPPPPASTAPPRPLP